MSRIAQYCQALPNIVKHFLILSIIAPHCKYWNRWRGKLDMIFNERKLVLGLHHIKVKVKVKVKVQTEKFINIEVLP